jgi:energy-coupling factor transporter ATP-binding protein EcfA2
LSKVELQSVNYLYPDQTVKALVEITLEIPPGSYVLIQGPTGCGKSTLLKCISGAVPEFYGGVYSGHVSLDGRRIDTLTAAERVAQIGFVAQDPEAQAVYSTVSHEVAFTLENIGVMADDMRWRVAEALEMVGMSGFEMARIQDLSGGQRQRVALASALVHQPRILVLDEPTSQLDPVSAEELFDILARLNSEFGQTIIISEHRVDRVYQDVHEVIHMENGRIVERRDPRKMAEILRKSRPAFIPSVARILPEDLPNLSVHELSGALARRTRETPTANRLVQSDSEPVTADAVALQKVSTRYSHGQPWVLDECSLRVPDARVTAVIGSNGAGKSTLLRVLAGLQKIQSGKIRFNQTLGAEDGQAFAYLPQNPNDLLSQETVRKELVYGMELRGVPERERQRRVDSVAQAFALSDLLERHPRDLSGGEKLRVAVSALLTTGQSGLLLDEPTRGLDAEQKRRLGKWLLSLQRTTLLATHDLDFAATYASRIVFLHRGKVVLSGTPRQVFSKALSFAPPIARAFRHHDPNIVCLKDAERAGWSD